MSRKNSTTAAVIDGLIVALAKHRHMESQLKDSASKHPHVIQALARIGGMADAFEAALEALRGNPATLDCYKD